MKDFLKVVGIGLIFYALTLSTDKRVVKSVSREIDSLEFYWKMSPEEYKSMQEDREFERQSAPKTKKGGLKNDR